MSSIFCDAGRKLAAVAILQLLAACNGDFNPGSSAMAEGSAPSGGVPTTTIPELSSMVAPEFLSASLPTRGLVLQLESDRGVQQSQNIVTNWWDQSGEDNSLTAVGGPRVINNALNSLPVIEFDGESSRLERTSDVTLPESNQNRTVIVLVKYDGTGAGGLVYGATICNGAFRTGIDERGAAALQDQCPQNDIVSDLMLDPFEWVIQAIVLRDSQLSHYINGQLIDTANHNFNTVADQLVIGGSLDGTEFEKLQIAAALVWDEAISNEEMSEVLGYLINKYLAETPPDAESIGSSPEPAPIFQPAPELAPQTPPSLRPTPAPNLERTPAPELAPTTPRTPAPEPAIEPQPPIQPRTPAPTVTLSTTNAVDGGVGLNWSTTNADSCSTRGPWANNRIAVNGRQDVAGAAIGDTFTLNCTNVSGTAVAMVTVINKSVRITWRDNPDSNVPTATRSLSYGSSSGVYPTTVEIPAEETSQVITVGEGPLHIVMRSQAADGTVSQYSNELVLTVR